MYLVPVQKDTLPAKFIAVKFIPLVKNIDLDWCRRDGEDLTLNMYRPISALSFAHVISYVISTQWSTVYITPILEK